MKLIPRLYEWYVLGIFLLAVLWHLRPQDLPVVMYKLALVAVAVVAGAILERRFLPQTQDATARAIIMAAVILGMTLGL